MSEDFECALSGEVGEPDEDGEMPLGWTMVTLQRKLPNPRWIEIQQGKAALVEATMSQMPPEVQEQMRWMVQLQIDAQFAELEGQTEPFEMVSEIVYISSPERDEQVMDAYNDLREKMGLDALGFPQAEDEEE
jgi:hypothetical protein